MSSITALASIFSFLGCLVLLIISISNLSHFRKLSEYKTIRKLPKLSVLLPVRNEEENIEKCVLSILKQDYPDFELLVLLDNCEDKTEAILRRLQRRSKKLQIIKGKPLPEGWYGKHWACYQLSQYAQGELLLFTDADTSYIRKDAFRRAVSALLIEGVDFLTGLPKEEAISLGEKLAIPFISFGIHSVIPVKLISRISSPVATVTIGQFMLFKREAYENIGGYEAIRSEVADDIALGRRIKEFGYKWFFLDVSEYVSCRMYKSLGSVIEGFAKNLFGVFNYRILTYFVVWSLVLVIFINPLYVLSLKFLGYSIPKTVLYNSLGSLMALVILFYISYNRFKYPILYVLLYPLTVLIWFYMALLSFYYTITGKASWKGRKVLEHEIRWL